MVAVGASTGDKVEKLLLLLPLLLSTSPTPDAPAAGDVALDCAVVAGVVCRTTDGMIKARGRVNDDKDDQMTNTTKRKKDGVDEEEANLTLPPVRIRLFMFLVSCLNSSLFLLEPSTVRSSFSL